MLTDNYLDKQRREEYTLNDLIYTPGSLEEIKSDPDFNPGWNEEAGLERSRKIRKIGEKLLRKFREREQNGQIA